jgi:hypothetical protein
MAGTLRRRCTKPNVPHRKGCSNFGCAAGCPHAIEVFGNWPPPSLFKTAPKRTRRRRDCLVPNCPLHRARQASTSIEDAVLPPFAPPFALLAKWIYPTSRYLGLVDARKHAAPPVYLRLRVPRLTITWKGGKARRRLEWVDAR